MPHVLLCPEECVFIMTTKSCSCTFSIFLPCFRVAVTLAQCAARISQLVYSVPESAIESCSGVVHVTRTKLLPSGYVKIAIENGHRNSGFSHEKWWIFPNSYVNVYQRVLMVPTAISLLCTSDLSFTSFHLEAAKFSGPFTPSVNHRLHNKSFFCAVLSGRRPTLTSMT